MLKLQDYLDAPDFDAAITELGASMRKAVDLPPVYQLGLVVRGRINKGPVCANFAYFDTREEHGIILELISMQVFGRYFDSPRPVYTFLGRLQKRPY